MHSHLGVVFREHVPCCNWKVGKNDRKWSENKGVSALSSVPLFLTPWTVARQTPLPMEFSRQGILKWIAISYSRESSQPRDLTCVSCIGRCILYHCATWEAPENKGVFTLKKCNFSGVLWESLEILSREEAWSDLILEWEF